MLSLFQFLVTSSEFTEHFPGLNKVHYHISGRNDFTVPLTSVVGRQNHSYEKYPDYTIYDERCPGFEVGFMTKYYLNYWKLSIIKNHTLTWKLILCKMKEKCWYWLQKLPREIFMRKMIFYSSTYFESFENNPF